MKARQASLMTGIFIAALASSSSGQTQTAQSAMVTITPDSSAYMIEGTIKWTYDRDAAEGYYTNAWDGSAPVVTTGTGAAQTSPGAPAPDGNALQQHAQAQRCTFFSGGALSGNTYKQTVNGTRGWKWEYTYNITPNQASVDPKTSWTSEETGGAVDIGVDGFVSSESYMAQTTGKKLSDKYSFTLLTSDSLSRVHNVVIKLEKYDATNEIWNIVGDANTYTELPVTSTEADYTYLANGGVFGNSAVYGKLHTAAPGATVSGILLQDKFANNDNDLASGNVHQANFAALFTGITEPGDYRVTVTGDIKDNSATGSFDFTVSSNLIVVGGCDPTTP